MMKKFKRFLSMTLICMMVFSCLPMQAFAMEGEPVTCEEHSYVTVITKNASCTEEGSSAYACINCGAVQSEEILAATGHSYVDGICTSCGEADPDYVAPAPAVEEEPAAEEEAVEEETAACEHDYVEGICTVCGGMEAVVMSMVAPVAETPVAMIGDAEYATLQAAMAEANKAAGNYTITLLADSAEVFAFAQTSGVNITIDGDGHTFTGKITLNAGGGNLTFTNATIAPANSQTIYLNASDAPDVTFDRCTLHGANKSGAIVYGYASATSNSISVKNCTADNLQYIVSFRQTGSSSVLVENVTATNMIYLVRTLKCPSVTVKNVTCDAVIGIDIKNDGAGGKLTLENVNINVITYGSTVYYPVSGSGAGASWTVEVKGVNEFSANDVAYEDQSWFNVNNTGYKTDIEAQNGTKFGSLAAIADDAKSGDTIKLLKDIDATHELPEGIVLDKNGFTADNVTVKEPEFAAMIGEQGCESLAEAFAEANKVAGDYTITLLADNAEEFAFAQNEGVNITVDGDGKTFTGKITLNDGAGELVITKATLTPSNADAKSIVLNAATAPNVTIDNCTLKNIGTKGAIVWGQASSTNNKVVIKNSTASNLQYLVGTNQAGCEDVTVENVTATNMAYLIRPMKAIKVTVKNVTYSGLTFVQVKNSVASTLAIENVTVTTTHAGMPPVTMVSPDAGNITVNYTITLKGENFANDAEMTPATEAAWFATAANGLLYTIKDLNGLAGSGTETDPYQIGSVEDLIMFRDSVNAGETKYNAPDVYVALNADIDMADATWERGIGDGINATYDGIFDGKEFTIKNLNLAPKADNENPETAYLCGGLFGYTYGAAAIKNVVLENITVTTDDAGHNVGVLVGFAYNDGGKLNVSNVTVKNVTINAPKAYGVGAIVGYSYFAMGTIENCSVDGADITGYSFVGGITGYSNSNAVINNCTVKNANITATSKGAGGIAGLALGGNEITGNTVAYTTVTAPTNWGYVVGELGASNAKVSNNTADEPQIGGDYATGEAYQAKIGDKYYNTLADAIAKANAGETITLLRDITSKEIITIDKAITLDGNDKTLTSTAGRAINVSGANGVTIKNLTINASGERAINVIQNATDVTIDNVTAVADNYTVNVASSAPEAVVAIKNSDLTGLNVVNVAAAGAKVTVDNTKITCNDQTDVESYAALFLNKDAAGATITATGVTFDIKGDSIKASNSAVNGTITIDGKTDEVKAPVAYISYGNNAYTFYTLADAIAKANAGETITLLRDITVSEGITNTKKVTLDLNGKTITGTDNATGSFGLITNKGELTITGNGKMTLTATNNRGWNAYSSVISNTVGGKLIVETGTIEHLGGTDMAYGIDNLTNGKGTYAETIINGGTVKSTYRAIRQFLNGTEAQNILTVNGGVVEGANKSIWMQDPSKNANTGKITVAEGATLNGDVYLTATEGSAEWPVEVSIAASTVNGEVLTNANVPECYVLENVNGTWEINKYAVVIGGQYYFETLADAVANAQNKNVLKLLCDCEGPGIVIDKNITIDFNKHTYTLTGCGAGSANTQTNGFQILKGNTVEFKNGTLKVADEAASKYAMLIQNYANLKIRNMTLDGTNLDYSSKVSYVVSINSGRVYFIGDVVVKSNDRNLAGDVAIDVYDYSAAGYDVPTVDIPETVKIDEYDTVADAAKAGKVLAAARASKVFYANVQQAIDNSASFSLVQDYVGPGFVIDKQVNINLGGFTLTINDGVGSANTKTNGIQILKGAKVGLSNGEIEAADNGKLAILIQNYGDVQITNVELDGTNLDYSSKVSYTLSINSGNVKLMGTTNVIANDRNLPGDVAIDVYDYSSAGYELPVVSISSTVTYTEGKILAAAKYGNYHYSSLQQCIDKHGTATLVCDFAGPGVVINKNATINFAGFTYTITEPVGSTGTVSNGFQVLSGNRLTMNNGTLKVADSAAGKFYILVQNYADLTLNSVTLDGTNLDKWSKIDGDSYTLSNNSGNVAISGTSKIIANNDGDKAFAFDVCDKTAWGYELPKVKVAATATIEGNIEAAAKIGVNYYATLEQAIADRDKASSKDEIVLMSNIVLEDTLIIDATKAIVLDLNGFTISQTKACTGHYAMIENKATLTIKDSVGGGKISFTDNGAGDPNFGWGSYTIVNKGKMIVNSGIIENLSAQNANGSVKHMYCAIQQNDTAAQLQINGGTISTPSYRSIRVNAGSLTFGAWATTEEGATIGGQVWIQPFADGIKVNVNNGKFSPRGVDGSSIYVENSSKTVAFRVNGGEFATKIGCANADALKGAIRAGSFTEDAIAKTNDALFHKNFVNK